jgi:hypothetical protein
VNKAIAALLLISTGAAAQLQWSYPSHAADKPEEGPLLRLANVVLADGAGGPLNGTLCTALGLTRSNEPFPVEQEEARGKDYTRSLNVSRHRGRTDIVMTRRSGKDITLFLTSVKGDLEKAVLAKGSDTQEIEVSAAASDFDAEKAFWLDTWLKDYDARHPAKR